MEQTVKILFLLFMSLAGMIFYMAVAHDTSPTAWLITGVLAAIVVVVSLILRRENPELLLRVATTTALALAIIAGVTWYYSRGRASGMVTVISAPIAVGLAIWSLLFTRHKRRLSPRSGQTQS